MKRQLKVLLLFVLLQLSNCAKLCAQWQSQASVDSLQKELNSEKFRDKEDTNVVKLLNTLSQAYFNVNPEQGLKTAEQALTMARELNWKRGMEDAYNTLGTYYDNQADYSTALDYYFKALKMDEEARDKYGIEIVTANIGIVYSEQGNYNKAIEYYLRSLSIEIERGDIMGIAGNKLNIGITYKKQKNFAKALEYEISALAMFEKKADSTGVAYADGNISEVYNLMKNYDISIQYAKKSLNISKILDDKRCMATQYLNIGNSMVSSITEALPDRSTVRFRRGNAVSKQRYFKEAIAFLDSGANIADIIGAREVQKDCFKSLSEAYLHLGDYKKGFENSEKYHAINDSVFSKENNEKIVKMEMKYEYDKKAAETQKLDALKLQRQRNLTYAGFGAVLLLLSFSYFIVKERRKTEKLLLNILPAEVAAELKSKGVTKARQYENVTIFFTDFVNFTSAGERLAPNELVEELHSCFKAFDEITSKYNIEKIKTIGDAYMAVCGLPQANQLHAANTVKAAKEIIAFMETRYQLLGEKTFRIRIGVHSGSVVAGIVGVKKFAYDIWGDTVNTAARMEQNSEPGKINISQTTYEIVKDKFTCVYRGEIDAKNKGVMKMYFVE